MVCVEAHISALADHILALEHKAWPPPHTSHLPGNHSHGLQCSSLSAPAHLAAPHDTLLGLDSQIPLIIHKISDLLSYIFALVYWNPVSLISTHLAPPRHHQRFLSWQNVFLTRQLLRIHRQKVLVDISPPPPGDELGGQLHAVQADTGLLGKVWHNYFVGKVLCHIYQPLSLVGKVEYHIYQVGIEQVLVGIVGCCTVYHIPHSCCHSY